MTDQEQICSRLRERLSDNGNGPRKLQSDLDLWKVILQIGSQCRDRLNTLAKSWWYDREIMACEHALNSLNTDSRSYGWPWHLDSDPYLDRDWLEQVEGRILQVRGPQQCAKGVLGIIKSADAGLAEVVQHYVSGAGSVDEQIFFEQLYRRQLVPLPQGSRLWSLSTNESSSTFYEGLSGVCYTTRPIRLWSKVQLGFPPSLERPQLPRVKLLAVRPEGSFDLRAQKIEEDIVFVVDHLSTPAELETVMQRFGHADEMVADIYLLPELAVSEADRRRLQDIYHRAQHPPCLWVAGSGHVHLLNADDHDVPANRSSLVYPAGSADHEPDVFHLKYEPFRLSLGGNSFALNVAPDLEAEVANMSTLVEGLAVQGGSDEYPLVYADTPWGRISFVICKDVLAYGDNASLDVLRDVGIDHLFVPSFHMGNRGAFQASARALRLHRIATYVVDGDQTAGGDANRQSPNRFVVHLPVPRPQNRSAQRETSYDVVEWSTVNLPDDSVVKTFGRTGNQPDCVFLDTSAISRAVLNP